MARPRTGTPSVAAVLVPLPGTLPAGACLCWIRGKWANKEIVPEQWVVRSTRHPDPEPVMPGTPRGYGYHWWTVMNTAVFEAIGIHGQFLSVGPGSETVIVKMSHWPVRGGSDAALVPRPQHNLTRYHGVFAPSAALRSRITPAGPGGSAGQQRRRKRRKGHAPPPTPTKANPPDQTSPDQPTAPLTWATRRVTYHSSESSTSTSHSVLIAVNGYGSSPKSRNPISSKPF